MVVRSHRFDNAELDVGSAVEFDLYFLTSRFFVTLGSWGVYDTCLHI